MDGIFITELEPGPGIRLAVKDLFDTAGVRTTYGSAVFAEHVPTETAEAVRRLEAAGYANVGKANLHEFAYGVTSQNAHYGTVPNPAAPGRTSGGSSGGIAAAIAAGLADAGARAPTRAARSGSRPRAAASPASSRRSGSSRPTACSRSHRASTTRGRWPGTSTGCVRADAGTRPGLRRRAARVARRGASSASPGARAPIRSCARGSRRRPSSSHAVDGSTSPSRSARRPCSCTRSPASTASSRGARRALRREPAHEDRALPRGDRRRGRRGRGSAARLRADCTRRPRRRRPAADADARVRGAARRHRRDRLARAVHPLHIPVQRPRLAGARARRAARREDGLPASAQLVGRPGDDARVLAAGLALEAALAGASLP